jgi:hypothetical protein
MPVSVLGSGRDVVHDLVRGRSFSLVTAAESGDPTLGVPPERTRQPSERDTDARPDGKYSSLNCICQPDQELIQPDGRRIAANVDCHPKINYIPRVSKTPRGHTAQRLPMPR